MNKQPDSDPDLEEDDIPDASELLDFELIAKSQPDKGQGLWLWVVLILILAGGGWAGWMYLQGDAEEVASADGVPTIMSPKFELKEKPTDPGGMDVPDRDKLVYDRMSGENDGAPAGVERLLPPPEAPIEPPAAVASQENENASRAVIDMPPPVLPQPGLPEAEAPKAEAPTAPQAVPTVAVEAVTPKAPPAPTAVSEPSPASPPPATPPAPVAPAPAKATASAGQGFLVQLSAVRTEQAAMDEWARLAKKNADVLGGLTPVIQRADLGTKGIYYRVRGGWLASRAEAKTICDELTRRNVGCIIAKP